MPRIVNTHALLFTKYLPMARSIAKKASLRWGRPYEEVWQHTLDAFTKALVDSWDRYNPEKAGVVTWLYQRTYFQTFNAMLKKTKRSYVQVREEDSAWSGRTWLQSVLLECGDEGRALLSAILEAPAGLAAELSPNAPVRSRHAIREYLSMLDWTPARIDLAWKQARAALA